MNVPALTATLAGFVSGSIMYSYLIPRMICGKDVRLSAADHNPGAANAGLTCGKGVGILCGVLDVLKGFAPVFIACMLGIATGWAVAAIVVAPALGHAFSPMLRAKGGKAIAPAYGALLGLLPWHPLGIWLAIAMVAAILLIKDHATAVSSASILFIVIASVLYRADMPIRLTAYLLSALLIYKHWPEMHAYLNQRSEGNERRKAA